MLATIFMIGLFALAGLFLLKLVFGLGFGLLGWLFAFAIRAVIVGGLIADCTVKVRRRSKKSV